ncbi:hypothetical protein MAB47J26_04980 [Mycobacteroides abscessus 47J26]|nr:hypothetical protein MAB47J26_04980 [Mycobacteroides abscessus 47J26]
MLGVGAVRVGAPEHRQVVVIDNLPTLAQNVVAEELIWGAAQLRLQGFGQGAPHNGWVQFCHRATVYEYRFKSEYTPLVER